MEKQGASKETVQGWLDSLKNTETAKTATPPQASQGEPKRGILGEILPVGGAILGGIGGGIAGTFAAGPGLGTWAGATLGAAGGGALGEAAQQGIEKSQGTRQEISGGEIAKTGLEQGAMEAIGGPLFSAGGKLLEGAGKAIYDTAFPVSEAAAKMLQTYKAGKPFLERMGDIIGSLAGKTEETAATKSAAEAYSKTAPTTLGDTAIKASGPLGTTGLIGTEEQIGVQAKRAATGLWDTVISPELKGSTEKVDLNTFFKEAEDKIINENPDLTRQKSLLNGLESIKEDYAGVGEVSLEKLQQLKEGWAKFVPQKAYKGEDIASAVNDVRNTLAGSAREKIYSSVSPDVKQAYIDYGNLKEIMDMGQKAMTGKGAGIKGEFSSAIWNTVKDMVVTPVKTLGGKTVYKVGDFGELIGQPGAKSVRQVILGLGNVGAPTSGTPQSAFPNLPTTPFQQQPMNQSSPVSPPGATKPPMPGL